MPDWANFCTECGTPLKSAPQNPSVPAEEAYYDVHISDVGPRKDEVAMYIKNVCNLNIQEVYNFLSSTPCIITNVPVHIAPGMFENLRLLSATVVMKPSQYSESEKVQQEHAGELVDLYILSAGPRKVDVVYYLSGLTGLTIQQVEYEVDNAPFKFYSAIPKEVAMIILQDLQDLSAIVDFMSVSPAS
ncbi:MAG: hypothetical protein K2L84_03915 [Muribaculaceae bacterium]|nr:hypothetical protein [Muribaculaceae bacterium]